MSASPDDILQRILSQGDPNAPGLLGLVNKATAPFGGAGNLGLQLLANSGYSSTPRSTGQVFAQSALNAQQVAAGAQEQQLKQQLIAAQLKALQAKPATQAIGNVTPSDYTPESVAAFQKSVAAGNPDYAKLVRVDKASDTPTDVREYEYAKAQGFKGGYTDWIAQKKTPADSSEIQGYKLAQTQGFKGTYLDYLKQKSAVQSVGDDLSPEDLDLAATTVMTDPVQMRQFASFGKAGQARRDQINSQIAKKLKDAGMTAADLGNMRANFKAQSGSINKLVPQLNAIEAYEQTAKFNGQRLLDLVDKIDNTGIPVIEGYARRAQKAVGDPDQAEFQSVLAQYQTEAARIINNPNLTGILSDSARHEMQEIVGGNMNAAQIKRVVNRLNTEFEFRKNAIRDQVGAAGQSMTNIGNAQSSRPVDIATTPTPKGQTKVINGVTYINLTGQPDGWHKQ
jgi:hypothetical protein